MVLRSRKARHLVGWALLLLILAAILISFRADDVWYWLLRNELHVREELGKHPLAAFGVGLVAFALISFVPGLIGKSLAVGWLFGFWQSLAIVNISMTIVAIVEYLFTRYLLRDSIQLRFGSQLMKVNQALARDGAFYVFSMRVAHFPYTATNYLLGATALRPMPFWFATQLGLLPSNILFCYAGSKLPSLADVSKHGLGEIMRPELWIGFVLLAIAPWIGKLIVGQLRTYSLKSRTAA